MTVPPADAFPGGLPLVHEPPNANAHKRKNLAVLAGGGRKTGLPTKTSGAVSVFYLTIGGEVKAGRCRTLAHGSKAIV